MRTIQEIVEENFKGLDDLMVDKELVTWYKSLIIECIRSYAEDVVDEILQDNSMIYVEVDGEANYSYEAFDKFKKQLK